MDRGTGQTTKQMREAPQGALFVWCNDVTAYPRSLASSIGRSDLRIEPLSVLRDPTRLRGAEFPAMVIDHAAAIKDHHTAGINMLGAYVGRRRCA